MRAPFPPHAPKISFTNLESAVQGLIPSRSQAAFERSDVIERGAEPFFTTKRPGEGSGLGLSVVAGIVQQHGGTLRLSNREGQGARVEVTLTVVDASPTIKPAAGQGRSLTPTDEGRRVLLAEDEEMVRNVLVRTLGRAGFEVLVATNGPEAVARGRPAAPPPHNPPRAAG